MANGEYTPFDTAQGLKIKEMINKRLWSAFIGLLVLIGLLATAGFFVVIRPAIQLAAEGIADSEFRAAVSLQVTGSDAFTEAVDTALQERADQAVGQSAEEMAGGLVGDQPPPSGPVRSLVHWWFLGQAGWLA